MKKDKICMSEIKCKIYIKPVSEHCLSNTDWGETVCLDLSVTIKEKLSQDVCWMVKLLWTSVFEIMKNGFKCTDKN